MARNTKRAEGHTISPLAPKAFPKLPPLAGVRLATAAAGVRYKDRTDVLLALLAPGTQVAGVFTRSKTASAPVLWCRDKLGGGEARALVVNSGNANAFTGKAGQEGVREIARAAAASAGCRPEQVFMASTGVIGEPLPSQKIVKVLDGLMEQGAAGNWRAAADAIMTTDTYPKAATATAMIDGVKVTINGIAKGSGMIAPDMATMLSFVFTDASLPASVLQECLAAGVGPSFNSITVDSDTSTSDTLLLFATGKGGRHAAIAKASDRKLTDFRRALDAVLMDLALQVVKDGEGAQKLIRIDVSGAENDGAAKRIALAIANSPLVKTAIAGNDANWGRIVMAVGKAGEAADRDRLRISFGGHVVAEKGMRAAGYSEAAATKAVSGREVQIGVELGLGKGSARVWTCDLTHGYIDINGSYRS
ncbi:MAG TPA: bifunctional glutamate N-acetyltransferase/amino-acid acetyltransferase ArgJ [Rhizomicrobium sp.]|jgi:glutamate N-acetyltransferase/amino-acid N-acetyltransferase|nr:bifunctional glutamate N-acetyltransferase/amino-acid acetyltransferase ArgJ [Rhizomicrobium sp.]